MKVPTILTTESPPDAWPPPASALDDPEGLIAIGGDLSPERLISAYRHGIFPWFNEGYPIMWWCPPVRMVFDRCEVHIGRSLRKRLKHAGFEYSMNQAFDRVISACADRPNSGTWITPAMQAAYRELHWLGKAHSVEVWLRGELVGGLYGLAMGRIFCGESMFSRVDDASKAALTWISAELKRDGFTLIDGQMPNPFLESMGGTPMARADFLARLAAEVE